MTLAYNDAANVQILLAVYNGGAHLAEQLESIAAQGHPHWRVIASDDGSWDNSRTVLDAFGEDHSVIVHDGPRQGAAANFLSLLGHADPNDWVAFADQDDIWLPDKLERSLAALKDIPPETPALFCSRSWISDADGNPLRLSPPRPRPICFRNALVQNVVAGNTILLNPAATHLVQAAAQEAGKVVIHDWWIYQIVSGAGGRIVHDDEPTLLYRQHGQNEIGANDSARERAKRIGMIVTGRFRDWNAINIAALRRSEDRLAPENRSLLNGFAEMRASTLPLRLWRLGRLRLYRQGRASTVALWLAAALNRL
ncbi:glycosyl transferase family 2 [Roseivivax halodurans JCM 10272]|uniref:Glycosyl transferase family 2 n=1 Tax=Roseivivax halodurans JCM 10272 TaxID=1449350 RepID=X7EC24_9RHOB|nr:glycosyltransferase family 2 protein [Roseivivax halodurans]ETX13482.1 glycosyl transferase family 2 [Roseivivax halodurans JCM 10272]